MTQSQIASDLRALGLHSGDHVLVHSSLRKVGPVDGGALAIIAALRDVVGREGTVVFPTHTGYETCSPENPPPFDARNTPSLGMGVLAETARQLPEAIRSLSPTHSVAAIGHLAEWLCEAHHLAPTPCGTNSPYERLARVDGRILLLGVDHENNTTLHWLEEKAEVPYHMLPGSATYEIIDASGLPITITARFHRWGDARNFDAVVPYLVHHGAQVTGQVGLATAHLICTPQLDAIITPILRGNPQFLLANPALQGDL